MLLLNTQITPSLTETVKILSLYFFRWTVLIRQYGIYARCSVTQQTVSASICNVHSMMRLITISIIGALYDSITRIRLQSNITEGSDDTIALHPVMGISPTPSPTVYRYLSARIIRCSGFYVNIWANWKWDKHRRRARARNATRNTVDHVPRIFQLNSVPLMDRSSTFG